MLTYPGPAIDVSWFPNTQSYVYWSATGYAGNASYAWHIYFNYGYVDGYYRSVLNYVRLVR